MIKRRPQVIKLKKEFQIKSYGKRKKGKKGERKEMNRFFFFFQLITEF